MKKNILLVFFIVMPYVSAFYTGYEVPGNHSVQQRVINMIPPRYWSGLSRIIFVKDPCVKAINHYEGIDDDNCYDAYFDHYWNKTTIRIYNGLSEVDMLWLMLHELQHLRQWREGRSINEIEADDFAYSKWGEFYGKYYNLSTV